MSNRKNAVVYLAIAVLIPAAATIIAVILSRGFSLDHTAHSLVSVFMTDDVSAQPDNSQGFAYTCHTKGIAAEIPCDGSSIDSGLSDGYLLSGIALVAAGMLLLRGILDWLWPINNSSYDEIEQ